MRVVLLGTGASAGVPMIGGADGGDADGHGNWGACDPAEPRNRRTRSSIVIEGPAGRLLVDTGQDLRTQMLAAGIGLISAILFTHAHADHISGLDDVRILNRIAGHPLDAYAMPETLAELERRFDYAFRPWEKPNFYRPVLRARPTQPGDIVTVGGVAISVFGQDHGFGRTLGLRAGPFGYSTDVVRLDDAAFEALRGIDTWVVGCFQRAPAHKTHAHLALVLAWANRVGARRTILTHLGTDMDWGWLRANLPPGVEPGYDGMELQFPMS